MLRYLLIVVEFEKLGDGVKTGQGWCGAGDKGEDNTEYQPEWDLMKFKCQVMSIDKLCLVAFVVCNEIALKMKIKKSTFDLHEPPTSSDDAGQKESSQGVG